MTGVVWFVQVVHYPLFPFAAHGSFPEFAAAHRRRTSFVVLPLMTVELASAGILAVRVEAAMRPLALGGLLLLFLIWLSTALVQVPLHRRLAAGFDAGATRRLVLGNWLRTVAWSLRSAIALALVSP